MAARLNHTIVHATDKRASADFYSEVFGFAKPEPFGPFLDVETANEVTLAILETDEEIQVQHYAFLVSEEEFDQIFGRVKQRSLEWWADPALNHYPTLWSERWLGRRLRGEARATATG